MTDVSLVRPSGTEPLLRVMAEAPTDEKVSRYVDTGTADVIRADVNRVSREAGRVPTFLAIGQLRLKISG